MTFANVGPYSVVIRARTWASVNLVTHKISRGMGWGLPGNGEGGGGSTVQPKLPRWRETDGERETEGRMSCHSICHTKREGSGS